MAAENNAIWTNYGKAKINNAQQNRKCGISGKRNEMIDYIVRKCSKFAQIKHKNRRNWVGRVTYWELWKTHNFDQTTERYMHKPESLLENETQKVLWDFEKGMDKPTPTRRP